MIDFFKINNDDIYTEYNLRGADGIYSQLLKLPARTVFSYDWKDQHGTQRLFDSMKFSPRSLDLGFVLEAENDIVFLDKFKALKTFFTNNAEFDFVAEKMDRLFKLQFLGMPNFEKLNLMRGNNSVFAQFSISVIDNYPSEFLDKNGDPIPMASPPDVADDPIDFSLYTFQIVGTDLIMTGPGDLATTNTYFINGNRIDTVYGLLATDGLYNEILKFPSYKDGSDKFQSRSLTLPFVLVANNKADFYTKYYTLTAFLLNNGYFNFDITNLNRRYQLAYSEMTDFEKLTIIENGGIVYALIKITFFDDFPELDETSPRHFDGRFSIVDGDLIYYQSDEFDDIIIFHINDQGELILTIQ